MGFRYIFDFQKQMNHPQYNRRHHVEEQDCHIIEFGLGLRLRNLQDKFPNYPKCPIHH